jgi:hypothetical protein
MGKSNWVEANGSHVLFSVIRRRFRKPTVDDTQGVVVKVKVNRTTGAIGASQSKRKIPTGDITA